ncbi:MAG: murein biosynthesis integral membrane protein MurJ [Candidatus Dojkabacteria bacterium]
MTAIQQRINNIKVLLSQEQTEILETALFAMLPVLLTKITGQLFSLIAASYFGTNDAGWNKFLLASSIPDLISNILITGAIGAVVIPILISAKRKEKKEVFLHVYGSMINAALIFFGIVSVVLIIFADQIFPFLLKLLGAEIPGGAADIAEIIAMMRALLLPQIILAVSVFVSNGLNVYNRYIVPQLAPLLFNIGRISAVVILVPILNYSPWAVVIGVFVGSFLHLLIQLPLARHVGLKFSWTLDFKNEYIRELFKISIPRTFAVASEHIALTFNDFLSYAVNGVAALNFANSLSLVVPQLFAFTFAYASFTKLSEHFADKDYKNVQSIIIKTMNEMLFLALPFVVTILVLRVPIVRLTFGLLPNTRLDLEGTYQIAWTLMWFAVGHIFVCGKWFMYRVFYANKETKVPLLIAGISLVLTIFLGIIFTNLFSHNAQYSIAATHITIENLLTRGTGNPAVGGIALGMSVAYTFEFFALLFIFQFFRMKLNLRRLFKGFAKKLIAGLVMGIVMYFMFRTWDIVSFSLPTSSSYSGLSGSTTINLFFLTVITVVTSFLVYYSVCLLLNVVELKILKRYINPVFRIGGLRID